MLDCQSLGPGFDPQRWPGLSGAYVRQLFHLVPLHCLVSFRRQTNIKSCYTKVWYPIRQKDGNTERQTDARTQPVEYLRLKKSRKGVWFQIKNG